MHQCISPVKARHQNADAHTYKREGDPRIIIRTLLKARGFRSARALALAAGVSQPTLSRYLSGDTQNMEMGQWVALAQTLEVTVSQLLGETAILDDPRIASVVQAMECLPEPEREALAAAASAMAAATGNKGRAPS